MPGIALPKGLPVLSTEKNAELSLEKEAVDAGRLTASFRFPRSAAHLKFAESLRAVATMHHQSGARKKRLLVLRTRVHKRTSSRNLVHAEVYTVHGLTHDIPVTAMCTRDLTVQGRREDHSPGVVGV